MSTRKTITVGRVKGSMVYSGTDFQVENPLENDLYLHNEEYAFYQYVAGNWIKVADLEEHSLETEGIKIGTSEDYNINSDTEIPTTKTVYKMFNSIKHIGILDEDPSGTINDKLNYIKDNGVFDFTFNDFHYLMIVSDLGNSDDYVKQFIIYGNPPNSLCYLTRTYLGGVWSIKESVIATVEEMQNEIAKLVDSAPDTLNTLKELSDALGNDKDFATTITNELSRKLNKTDVINTISSVEENNPTDKPISAYKAYQLQHNIDTANANRNILKDRVDKLFDENTTYDFTFENNKLKITSSNKPQSFVLNCDVNPTQDYNSNFAIYNTSNAVIYDGTWRISNGWKYYLIVDSEGRVQYASYHPAFVGIQKYASHSMYSDFSVNPVRSVRNGTVSLIIPEGSFLLVCSNGDSNNAAHSNFGINNGKLVSFLTNDKVTTLSDSIRDAINTQGVIPDNIRIHSSSNYKTIKVFRELDKEIEIPSGGGATIYEHNIQIPVSDSYGTNRVFAFRYLSSDPTSFPDVIEASGAPGKAGISYNLPYGVYAGVECDLTDPNVPVITASGTLFSYNPNGSAMSFELENLSKLDYVNPPSNGGNQYVALNREDGFSCIDIDHYFSTNSNGYIVKDVVIPFKLNS